MADDTVTVVDVYRTDLDTSDENRAANAGTLSDESPDGKMSAARADVEQTRANIGDTLSAIQDKLDPKELMAQAKDTVSEMTTNVTEQAKTALHDVASDVMGQAKSTAHDVTQEVKDTVGGAVTATKEAVGNAYDATRKAGVNLADTAMKNPVPTLLLLGGAYYLWSSWNSSPRRRQDANYRTSEGNRYDITTRSDEANPSVVHALWDTAKRNPIPAALAVGAAVHLYSGSNKGAASGGGSGAGSAVSSTLHNASDTVSQTVKAAGEKAGDAVSGAKDAIGGAVSTAKDAISGAATSVQSAASQATHSAGEFLGNVGTSAKDAGGEFVEYVQRNPLPAAAWALGLGALLAFLLPDTEAENRLYGATRDNLIDTAQHSATELLDKVQSVSTKTLAAVSDTVQQEAKTQGLTS